MISVYKNADQTVVHALTGIPNGRTILTILWEIKKNLGQPDKEILSKTITTALTSQGQIVGTTANVAVLKADIVTVEPGTYVLGVKGIDDLGDVYAFVPSDDRISITESGVVRNS